MASGPFEALLIDAAKQAERAASAAESTLRRVEQVSRDMFELSQRVAKLEEAKEWNGLERRKVDERLGSGDHTFQKLQTELQMMGKELATVSKLAMSASHEAVEIRKSILKREDKKDSRRHAVLMLILKYAVPPIISGIGAMAGYYFMTVIKGGPSP